MNISLQENRSTNKRQLVLCERNLFAVVFKNKIFPNIMTQRNVMIDLQGALGHSYQVSLDLLQKFLGRTQEGTLNTNFLEFRRAVGHNMSTEIEDYSSPFLAEVDLQMFTDLSV